MRKPSFTFNLNQEKHSKLAGLFLAIKRFARRCQNTEREIRTI